MITRIALVIFVLFGSVSAFAASGGGSSGVGNPKIVIAPGLESNVARPEAFKRSGDHLLDAKTGEKLMKIEHIKKSDLNQYHGKLANSHLGSVSGYEYLPNYSDAVKENFWVICLHDDDCIRLIPESDSNSKVQALVGGLQKSK